MGADSVRNLVCLSAAECKLVVFFYFFFSSRRRHTRFDCDWSSDVCSSDLVVCNGCGGRGTPTGQRLSANEQAVALAGAVELGRASVGAAVNYYATTLAEASGGAASFSAGVRGQLSSKLAIGASVQYLGGQVDVGGFGAPLPRTVRAGAELRPSGRGHERVHRLLAAHYAAVRGAPGRLGGGIEAGLADPATQLLAVARLGYLSRAGGDFDQRPLTLGLGVRFRQVSLDYAYQGSAVPSHQPPPRLALPGRRGAGLLAASLPAAASPPGLL